MRSVCETVVIRWCNIRKEMYFCWFHLQGNEHLFTSDTLSWRVKKPISVMPDMFMYIKIYILFVSHVDADTYKTHQRQSKANWLIFTSVKGNNMQQHGAP